MMFWLRHVYYFTFTHLKSHIVLVGTPIKSKCSDVVNAGRIRKAEYFTNDKFNKGTKLAVTTRAIAVLRIMYLYSFIF